MTDITSVDLNWKALETVLQDAVENAPPPRPDDTWQTGLRPEYLGEYSKPVVAELEKYEAFRPTWPGPMVRSLGSACSFNSHTVAPVLFEYAFDTSDAKAAVEWMMELLTELLHSLVS